ncbi:MAG: hypothetical protein ABR880_20970 [Candidatus Sulfotelmatobacter sp.]
MLATFSPVIRSTPPAIEGNFIIEREMRREADWKSPSGITEITVAGAEAMVFNVDESTALLHVMYPNYPDMRNSRRSPSDLQKWLQQYRERMAETEASESSRSS